VLGQFPNLKIIRCRMDADLCGTAQSFLDGSWVIRINQHQSWQMALETLIHEMGHVLGETENHGRMWGIKYAFVYRMYQDWLEQCG
jgi:hypothetical protein